MGRVRNGPVLLIRTGYILPSMTLSALTSAAYKFWNPDLSHGDDPWTDLYNDEDTANPYWIILNSWGDANGSRPRGTWRLDMNINYDSLPGGDNSIDTWL